MKRIFIILCLAIASILSYSCNGETCTSGYMGALKIDEKKADKISIKYIGPKKRSYETEFGFYPPEQNLPYFQRKEAMTNCNSKDFKAQGYNFLEIQNLGTENVIICGVLEGTEVDKLSNSLRNKCLLEIYGKQDQDPNYDYTKDKQFEGIKLDYVDRYEFYEQLIKDKYPYIIKLAPQQTCIMKWGGLGFKVL